MQSQPARSAKCETPTAADAQFSPKVDRPSLDEQQMTNDPQVHQAPAVILTAGNNHSVDFDSATEVLRHALKDMDSQLAFEEGREQLKANLGCFLQKLREIEAHHDLGVRDLENDWRRRLRKSEERASQYLKVCRLISHKCLTLVSTPRH